MDKDTTKQVSHKEATQIALRLISGSFRRDGERLERDKCPRFSIPTRVNEDDDCLIIAYIEQQEAADAYVASLIESLIRRDAWVGDETLERISQAAEDKVNINSIITPNSALAILSARSFPLNQHVRKIEEAQRADTMPLTSGETPDTENQDADFPAVEPVTEKQNGS